MIEMNSQPGLYTELQEDENNQMYQIYFKTCLH